MAETRWTPGPWGHYRDDRMRGNDAVIFGNRDNANAETEVAVVCGGKAGARAVANAHLIAAAPELYEALAPVERDALAAGFYCPDDVADDHVVIVSMTIGELRAARAALAKARGEQ